MLNQPQSTIINVHVPTHLAGIGVPLAQASKGKAALIAELRFTNIDVHPAIMPKDPAPIYRQPT